MTTEELQKMFDAHEDEYLRFDRVPHPKSRRPDLHAFIILDQLVPDTSDIVACSEHDEFWLSVSVEKLASVVQECQVIELLRCGVIYDTSIDALRFNT